MDFPSTQVIVDEDQCTSTNRPNASSLEESSRMQVATLTIGSIEYAIHEGVNTIGRHPASDIYIIDSTVSKHHGEIEVVSGQKEVWICDLKSSNKTRLNNAFLRPSRCYPLTDGSIIEFGRVRATYRIHRVLNVSTVPETPAADRRRRPLGEMVIAATPDSSLNNSSGLAGDVSAIPATQDSLTTVHTPQLLHQQQPVQSLASTSFLRSSPRNDTLAEATSSTCDKNICSDSDAEANKVLSRNEHLKQNTNIEVKNDFCPDSDDEAGASDTETRQRQQSAASVSSTLPTVYRNDSPPIETNTHKAPANCPSSTTGIRIYDMETQKPEEVIGNLEPRAAKNSPRNSTEMEGDIHDIETQIDDLVVDTRRKHLIIHSPRNGNPDRNSERETNISIYDMDTQKPEETVNHVVESAAAKLPRNRSEIPRDIHDLETQKEDFHLNNPRKHLIVHSPTIDNSDGASECENETSIYNIETQKPEETINRINESAAAKLSLNRSEVPCDIHDMETQIEDFQLNTARKNLIVHSPRNDSSDSSSETENEVNIYNLETQKPFQQNDQALDIQGMETQNFFSDDTCEDQVQSNSRKQFPTDTHTIKNQVVTERISSSENQDDVENIYDKETQCTDVPLIMSASPTINPEQIDAQDDKVISESLLPGCDRQGETTNDFTSQMETQKINSEDVDCEVSKSKPQNSESGQAVANPLNADAALRNNTNYPDSLDDSTSPSQERLKLSLEANFEEDCKELDVTVSNRGSQNLLENYTDAEALEHLSMTAPHRPSSVASIGLNQSAASSDEDDIFDAVTQKVSSEEDDIFNAVTQRVSVNNCKYLKPSFESDDSETDEEGVFVNIASNSAITAEKNIGTSSTIDKIIFDKDREAVLRFNIGETQEIIMNQSDKRQSDITAADDDDSITDEEGFFTQFVEKVNHTAGPSSTAQENNNCSHSQDSDDIYDLPTQPIKLSAEERANFSDIVTKHDDENTELDETVTTQKKNDTFNAKGTPSVIAMENPIETAMLQPAYNINDVAPTQLIHASTAVDSPKDSPSCCKENKAVPGMSKEKKSKELETESDIDNMAPTQVIHVLSTESSLNDQDNLILIETQPLNMNRDNISPIDSPPCFKKNKGTSEISKENKSNELETMSDIDDMAPTQIIRVVSNESPLSKPNTRIMIETPSGHLKGNDISPIDSPPCFKKNKGTSEISKENKSNELETMSDIDDMAPTQIIRVVSNESSLNKPNNLTMIETPSGHLKRGDVASTDRAPCSRNNEGRFKTPRVHKSGNPIPGMSSNTDDMGPTQIICDPSNEPALDSSTDSLIFENDNSKSKEGDTSDIDMLPTQVIRVPKEACNAEGSDDPSDGYSSDASGLYTAEKCGIEDIEYEMAPTQLISEVETEPNKKSTNAKKVKKGSVKKTRGKTRRKAKANLDDTIERNLNNMFDEVNTQEVQEPPMLSTQLLEKVLQDDKPSESTATTSNDVAYPNTVKESVDMPMITINENVDSQNSDNYFSIMTSTRKKNVFSNSQDSTDLVPNKCSADETMEEQELIIDEIETDSVQEGSGRERNADGAEQICNIVNTELKKQDSSLATCDQNNTRDDVKNVEKASLSAADDDMFDEYLIPKISESLVHPSIVIDDDEVDIMEGLPEVAKQAQGDSGGNKASNQNGKRVSVGRKQSVPKKLEKEQIETKTPKESEHEANVFKHKLTESMEDMGSAKRARRSSVKNTANSKQSPSIRDFFPKRESPLTIERPQSPVPLPSKGKLRNTKNVENTNKSVENTNKSFENTNKSVETINTAIHDNTPEKSTRRTRRKITKAQVTSNTSYPDNEAQFVKSERRTKLQKLNPIVVHPPLSEESQEVEMIMSHSILEPKENVERNAKSEEASKQPTKGRRGRKRLHSIESKSNNKKDTSSEVSASEQPSFEVPVSKPKRAKVTNISINSASDTSITESTKKGTRSGRYSQRSLANSSTTSVLSPSPSKTRQKVLFTGITNTNDYTKILAKLGASQVEDATKCTVLVTDKVRRTVKFLCALAQSTPIVAIEWLVDSEQMGQFVDMDDYILSDQESERKFGFKLKTSLERAQTHKLLDGYTIILTPNVGPPPIPDLRSMISACGGKPLIRAPTKWPEKSVIISNETDIASARKILAKAPKGVSVQSTEFLLTGILQQQLNFAKFKLI